MGMVAILVSLSNGGVTENLASIRQAVSKEKKFSNVETEWPWTLYAFVWEKDKKIIFQKLL